MGEISLTKQHPKEQRIAGVVTIEARRVFAKKLGLRKQERTTGGLITGGRWGREVR